MTSSAEGMFRLQHLKSQAASCMAKFSTDRTIQARKRIAPVQPPKLHGIEGF